MLDLEQILSFYPERLRPFRTSILREYLQHKMLEALGSSPLAAPLVFMGGTCIHLVHGNPRFSEDLDFDNRGLAWADFEELCLAISRELGLEGYAVELTTSRAVAFHASFRFSGVLQQAGLSGHREAKLRIRLDTETQGFAGYRHDDFLLNRFDVFQRLRVVPAGVLLAQKLHCIFGRKRPMGRDFFDTVFLMGKTGPDFVYLEEKLGIGGMAELRERLRARCAELDFRRLARDVEPFIFNAADTRKVSLFPEFVERLSPA
jgi:hypothetical protein